MSSEEIRFSYGKDSFVKISKNGKISYHGSQKKKLEAELGPLLNGIKEAKITKKNGKEYTGIRNDKIDAPEERDLLNKLKSIFSADGDDSISDDELKWANVTLEKNKAEFYENSQIVIADSYINKKYDEINEAKENNKVKESSKVKENSKNDESVKEETIIEEKDNSASESKEGKKSAEPVKDAKAEKAAQRQAYSERIDKIKEKVSADGITSKEYTIKKGDSYWNIAVQSLKDEKGDPNYKPKNAEVEERIALILKLNDNKSLSNAPLYANHTLKVPTFATVEEDESEEIQQEEEAQGVEQTEQTEEIQQEEQVQTVSTEVNTTTSDDEVTASETEKEPTIPNHLTKEHNEQMQKILATKDYSKISELDFQATEPDNNGEYDYNGDAKTLASVAFMLKEIRDKENRGIRLSDNDKDLKALFINHARVAQAYNSYDPDKNGKPDYGTTYDVNGKLIYIGERGNFEGITLSCEKLDNLKKFQNDYKNALKTIEAAEDSQKAEVKAEQFKALYAKYAETKGDETFACSALANKNLLEYADFEDVKKAISNNGVEFLAALHKSDKLGDDQYDPIVKKAIEVYKNPKKYTVDENGLNNLVEIITFQLQKPGDRFQGSEETLKSLAGLMSDIRKKENSGLRLSEDEKKLKEILQAKIYDATFYYSDMNNNSTLGITYIEDGKIIYSGEYSNDLGGVIYAEERQNVENFQKDYKAALSAINEAEDGNKDEVKAEQFKALYAKYAETKDDETFAKNVLASDLLKYAEEDDVLKALSNYGLGFIDFLSSLYVGASCSYANETLTKAAIEKAIDIYTNGEKGNISNLEYIDSITNSIWENKIDNEDAKAKILQIYESYFKIEEDAQGGAKTYTFNPSRRMTYDEAKGFLSNLSDPKFELPIGMQKAIMETLEIEDIDNGEWGELCTKIAPEIREARFASLVSEMQSSDEAIDFLNRLVSTYGAITSADDGNGWGIKSIVKNYGYVSEVADIINKYGDNNTKKLLALKYFIDKGDGTYTLDLNRLPSDIKMGEIMKPFVNENSHTWDAEWEPFLNAIFEAMDFNTFDNNDQAQIYFLNKFSANHNFTPEQKTKLLDALKNNSQMVWADIIGGHKITEDNYDFSAMKTAWNEDERMQIYDLVNDGVKKRMAKEEVTSDDIVYVKSGDTFYNILRVYMSNHMEKCFPKLAAKKGKWDKWKSFSTALGEYYSGHGLEIAGELGLRVQDKNNEIALKEGQILDFRFMTKEKWEKYQPNRLDFFVHYNLGN